MDESYTHHVDDVNMIGVDTYDVVAGMDSMNSRLRAARIAAGFSSAAKAASRLGAKGSTYAAHENGQNEYGPAEADRYGRAFGVRGAWLLTGEAPRERPGGKEARSPVSSFDPDEPSDDGDQPRAPKTPGEVHERDVRAGMGMGGYASEEMEDGKRTDAISATWRFPVSFLHAELRAREDDVDIIPVDGDSMIPTLLPGDRVMIHRGARSPSPDGLFAIDDGVGISIKRLQIVRPSDPLQVRIISDNAVHSTDVIQASDLVIIGRVICKVTRL